MFHLNAGIVGTPHKEFWSAPDRKPACKCRWAECLVLQRTSAPRADMLSFLFVAIWHWAKNAGSEIIEKF